MLISNSIKKEENEVKDVKSSEETLNLTGEIQPVEETPDDAEVKHDTEDKDSEVVTTAATDIAATEDPIVNDDEIKEEPAVAQEEALLLQVPNYADQEN